MEYYQRTDDFRCHDWRMVEIIPDRLPDRLLCAKELYEKGIVTRVSIDAAVLDDFSFLEEIAYIPELYFKNMTAINSSRINLSQIRNVVKLGGVEFNAGVNWTEFKRLEVLDCSYSPQADFRLLENLKTLWIGNIKNKNSILPLRLPAGLQELGIQEFLCADFEINGAADLRVLRLIFGRGVGSLAEFSDQCPAIEEIELHSIRGTYDYKWLGKLNNLRELELENCEPITDWQFLDHMNLSGLCIDKTKTPDPDSIQEILKKIDHVYLPKRARKQSESRHVKVNDVIQAGADEVGPADAPSCENLQLEQLARTAIKAKFSKENKESSVTQYVAHHLDELEADYWMDYLGIKHPKPNQVLDLLELQSSKDRDDGLGITALDFTLPGGVTDYVICVKFNGNGQIDEISMES